MGAGAVNLNELSRRIALREGKKKQVSIAQVKEVLSIALDELANANPIDVAQTLKARKHTRIGASMVWHTVLLTLRKAGWTR